MAVGPGRDRPKATRRPSAATVQLPGGARTEHPHTTVGAQAAGESYVAALLSPQVFLSPPARTDLLKAVTAPENLSQVSAQMTDAADHFRTLGAGTTIRVTGSEMGAYAGTVSDVRVLLRIQLAADPSKAAPQVVLTRLVWDRYWKLASINFQV